MSSYLLYTSCFHQKQYIDIVVNMLNSYFDTGATIDFLVYTTTEYRAIIESCLPGKPVKFFEKNFVKTMNHARISKVDIFDYPEIANYDKIVYIDADTMFLSDPTPLFDTIVDDVVYASGEGNILCEANYWGKYLFLKNDANYPDQEGFSVSCMGFKNLPEIKKLFSKIKQAFYLDMYQNKLAFYDQPYFNMILITNNMVNKTDFKTHVLSRTAPEKSTGLVAVHFAGCPGHAQIKLDLFAEFKAKYVWPIKEEAMTTEDTMSIEDQGSTEDHQSSEEPVVFSIDESSPPQLIDEARLHAHIQSTNPGYHFHDSSKRANLVAAATASKNICFLCGDTAIPSAIVINNNNQIKTTIVEHATQATRHQILNEHIELSSIDELLSQGRKFDTIICDEREHIERVIVSALRLAAPSATIIMNGIENHHVSATWQKYVDMMGLRPGPFPDTETQSVRTIL
jgi:hypothetical protein